MITFPIKIKSVTVGALLILAVFLSLRLPGLDLPYHQDEWKNVSASENIESAGSFFTHPPLQQMLFVAGHEFLGPENMRLIPLAFFAGSGLLLFFIVKRRFSHSAAWWSVSLFAVCAYGIHGSLSPDVDGAILPFFFLLALYAYDRWVGVRETGAPKREWLIMMFSALLLGLLAKLSFILVVGVFFIEYLWGRSQDLSAKRFFGTSFVGAAFVSFYIALLYLIEYVYPAFQISSMLDHAQESTSNLGRNWIQIAVQSTKAVYLLSPILIAPLLFTSREVWTKARPFFIYLIVGLIFYLGLFDFSRAALDKYLLFLIVPLSAIVGMVLAKVFRNDVRQSYIPAVLIGVVVSATLVALNFLPHSVVPLYPKTEWFTRVLQGEWNILNPFNGGNGPMGFYVSFLFMAASFIVSGILVIVGIIKRDWRGRIAVVLLVISLAYNAVLAEELLYGKINGSAPQVLVEAVEYIASEPSITQVLTYNDIGAGELSAIGKYAGRIYATPDAEELYRDKFAGFRGHYLVVEIPLLYDGFYSQFFSRCAVLFETYSKNVPGRVYGCGGE